MTTHDSDANGETHSVVARLLAGSRVIAGLSRVRNAALPRIRAVQSRLGTVVHNAWLYGWLTAEPDPEVIVIDLRETWTVGPFIRVLDRAMDTFTPWYRQSALKRGIDGIAAVATRAADTRPGRLLVDLFEPPEPPRENGAPPAERDREED